MARKGNQQMNGVDRHASSRNKKVADSGLGVPNTKGRGKSSEVKAALGEELPNVNHRSTPTDCAQTAHHGEDVSKTDQDLNKAKKKEGPEMDKMQDSDESVSSSNISVDCRSPLMEDTPSIEEEDGTQSGSDAGQRNMKSAWGYLLNSSHLRNMAENVDFSGNGMLKSLKVSALSMLKVVGEWVERQKPSVFTMANKVYSGRDYAKRKLEQAYPVVLKWLTHLGTVMLILTMVWLDSTLRGIDSFFRLGITSFFSVIWFSIISIIGMIGVTKFLITLAIAALMGIFVGITVGLLIVATCGLVFLWSYGSFWTTTFVMVIGGLTFMFSRQRITLLILTAYSVYCAWTYSGWLGLLLAFNLSFISSDILTYFVKNNIDQQSRSNSPFEQSEGMDGPAGFADGEPYPSPFSEAGSGSAADRSSGIPSTSGMDAELTSEDEIVRLLNCNDHYSVWGMRRYEDVDVTLLKREYRKKAMLVHPDKNMGNEKAAEAFKKLQNAYEVLLDSTKQKAYDDELRRDDFLNYFRRFHTSSQKNGGRGFFGSGFTHSEADCEDPFGDSRRIACKKCGDFHLWVHTKKSKSRARWCQDCKDFHQAKDGDGWVEQSSQPLLFGLLQKVDPPSAYVCADSKIYKATEWYICQGMRCPANTHKPSFHVNTSVTSNKQSAGKASSAGQRSGRMPGSGPGPGLEESMTEEEFMEWLKNAVQAGVFDNFSDAAAAESPSARAGNGPKSSTSGSSSSSSSKRKKKGKKQW